MDVTSAVALLKRGLATNDLTAVNAAARSLIDAKAPLGRSWKAVAQALARNYERSAAKAALDLYLQTDDSPEARFASAAMLAQMGLLADARTQLGAIAPTVPTPAAHAYLAGSIALNLGDHVQAEQHFLDALADNPQSGQVWLSLTQLVNFADRPALADAAEEVWRNPPADALDRANLSYALGRARHQRGDHAGAFDAFTHGAAARLASDQAQPGPVEPGEATMTPWPAGLIARTNVAIRTDHTRVIFVTGLPRSGTTLVEQILTSSRQVVDGGELGFFRILEQEVGGTDAASFERWLAAGGDPDTLVQTYLHLASERFGPDGRFVDKSLEASRYLGLLLALFPSAPLWWMRRDPIDTGWSVFRTYFAEGVRWGFDLGTIGRRLALEDRLFDQWTEAMPARIGVGDYRALVEDPVREVPRMAQALGLDFVPAMLRPDLAQRTVTTASVTQVREPINRAGLDVAAPYRRWLSPMIDAYAAD